MKKLIPTIAQLTAYLCLPITFIAAGFHQVTPQAAGSFAPLDFLFKQQADLFLPIMFATTVMTFALIIVHNLREDERMTDFANLHLRMSSSEPKTKAAPRKARLATAKAI